MSRSACAGRILEEMKPERAASRRFLSESPFNKEPVAQPPAEQYAVQDRVTHDRYGLGRVILVGDDNSLIVDFGPRRVWIQIPCAKLTKV